MKIIISARKAKLSALLLGLSAVVLMIENITDVSYGYQITANKDVVENGFVSATLLGDWVVWSSPFDTRFVPDGLASDNKIKSHLLISKDPLLHGVTVHKAFEAHLQEPTQFTIPSKDGANYTVTVTVQTRTGLATII